MTPKQKLKAAVQSFKSWAVRYAPGNRVGEWETEYDDWSALHQASAEVLSHGVDLSDSELRSLLLYVIARDNEVEYVVNLLDDSQALALVSHAISEGEPDAKWQMAVRLGKIRGVPDPEPALLKLATDSDEYVRRRAIMTLADLGFRSAEQHAVAAWDTGDQYQRMATLHALRRLNSPLLDHYLELAVRDGREHLIAMAKKV